LRDGDELRAEHAARQWWASFRAQMADSEFLMLTRQSVRRAAVSDLALHVADHGQYLRQVIRHDLAEDADTLRHVLWLREVEKEFGYPEFSKKLAALAADGTIARTKPTQTMLALVAQAFDSADMIALSQMIGVGAGVIPQTVQPPLPVFRVMHTTLAAPGARAHTHGVQRARFPNASGDPAGRFADVAEDGPESNPPGTDPGSAGQQPPPRPGRRDGQLKRRHKKRQVRKRLR
jgi:hypothetical protein